MRTKGFQVTSGFADGGLQLVGRGLQRQYVRRRRSTGVQACGEFAHQDHLHVTDRR